MVSSKGFGKNVTVV